VAANRDQASPHLEARVIAGTTLNQYRPVAHPQAAAWICRAWKRAGIPPDLDPSPAHFRAGPVSD
jgi:hypothetical protein